MALILLQAAPASASSSCWSWGCDGKDPAYYHCSSDAYTLSHFYYAPVYYELRYSPKCGAAWTRMKNERSYSLNTDVGMINTYNCLAAKPYCRVGHFARQVGGGTTWTKMMAVKPNTGRWFRPCMSYHANTYPDYCGPTVYFGG